MKFFRAAQVSQDVKTFPLCVNPALWVAGRCFSPERFLVQEDCLLFYTVLTGSVLNPPEHEGRELPFRDTLTMTQSIIRRVVIPVNKTVVIVYLSADHLIQT